MEQKTEKSLVEGLERLGMMAAQIRKNGGALSQLEIDILLEELRDLYRVALASQPTTPREEKEVSVREAAIEAARRAEEEAAARKKAEEEAAARKKAEEEAAARKKAEEEAAARKKAEEEAAARKKAEEEAAARKRAEEAAAARKKAEEEAAARKRAEEEEAKPIFAPEEPAREESPIMPPMMETLEGNANDTLFESDERKTESQPQSNSLFSYLNSNPTEEKTTKRTLADTLNVGHGNVEEQLEKKVNAKKVDDLRTIININDKFSFMSELFHNNMKAYNDFILRLNSIGDRQQALEHVKTIAAQYNWNPESLVVKSFYKIFDRKF